MGNLKYFDNAIEDKLLDVHTAYIGRILSISGQSAKVQPLNMVKQYGGEAKKQSPVTALVLNNALYKLYVKELTYVKDVKDHTPIFETIEVMTYKPLVAGDLVFCVCGDRDISSSKNGSFALPPVGHHSMSDSVIVGALYL